MCIFVCVCVGGVIIIICETVSILELNESAVDFAA